MLCLGSHFESSKASLIGSFILGLDVLPLDQERQVIFPWAYGLGFVYRAWAEDATLNVNCRMAHGTADLTLE